jgi:hypothetical protein
LLFSKYSSAPSPYALESVQPALRSVGRYGWPHTGEEEHSEVHRHMARRSAHRAAPKPKNSRSWSCHPSHGLMQLLPRGVQELPRPATKNRIGAARGPAGAATDAARPGSGWDPASGRLESCPMSCLERPASCSSSARHARRLPQSRSPERPL